jgi:hypothetical protein
MRPQTTYAPGMATRKSSRKMKRRPIVAALERVACWYIAARGRETMLVVKTSGREVVP